MVITNHKIGGKSQIKEKKKKTPLTQYIAHNFHNTYNQINGNQGQASSFKKRENKYTWAWTKLLTTHAQKVAKYD